jgi:alkylation response protein AidB-like acyl-CoA dehydrogenase
MVEQLSYHDASVGWNFTIGSGSALALGFLSPGPVAEILADPNACIAGQLAPNGRARQVDGGYLISGRWGWASGIHQATWLFGGCIVTGAEGQPSSGPSEIKHVFMPKNACDVRDTWHVGGMRGTGSGDFEVQDYFVPKDYTFRLFETEVFNPATIFKLPSSWFGIALSLVPSGAARAALDALIELAGGKSSAMTRSKLKERPGTQYDIAKCQVLLESSQEHVYTVTRELWEAVCSGSEFGPAQRARVRRATVHAAEVAAEVVATVYRNAGASALLEANDFEQRLRDVNAALGHVTLHRAIMEDAGRVAVGLSPLVPIF